jgi:hypothetical protein
MRYDTPVYFQRVRAGAYDPDTGDYGTDTVAEERRWASVTSSGTETLTLVYGGLRQDTLTLRLQTCCRVPFDRIRIGDKLYRVDFSRRLRRGQSFVVSEVQHGGD